MATKKKTNTISALYKTIDQKQLSEQAKETLKKLRLATGNFRSKDERANEAFNAFYTKLLEKKPSAVKTTKEYKDMVRQRQVEHMKKIREARKEKEEGKKGQGNDRDAARPAKPYGWRLRGKHNYRKPTLKQIRNGEAYYEGRVNRADVKRKKFPMLEKGGKIDYYNPRQSLYGEWFRDVDKDFKDSFVMPQTKEEYRKKYDTYKYDGENYEKIQKSSKMMRSYDALVEYNLYENLFQAEMDSDMERYYNLLELGKYLNIYPRFYMAKGGYMANGGEIKVINLSDDDKLNYFIKKQDPNNRDYAFMNDMLTATYEGKKFYSLGYDTPHKGRAFSLEEAKQNARIIADSDLGKKWDVIIKEVGGNFGDEDFTKASYVVMTSPLFPKEMLREMQGTLKYAKGGIIRNGDELTHYEPYFEKNVRVASIDEDEKIIRPSMGYFYPNKIAKKTILWAKNNGYKFIQDGKEYAKGGYMEDGGVVYYVNDFYPNYDEDKIAKILKDNGFKKVRKGKKYGYSNQPVVVMFEGNKNTATDILEKEFENYISVYEKDWGRKMADGGFMEHGGNVIKPISIDELKKIEGSFQSYSKGVMAGKRDEGYVTIRDEEDLMIYLTQKLGNVVKNISVKEIGKDYPDNMSNPYFYDTYAVELIDGTKFDVERKYGIPNWGGNVDYIEEIKIKNKMAKGGVVYTDLKDIPNLMDRVERGYVTYRGLGAFKEGTEITVDGKKYIVTDDDFNSIARDKDGNMRIRFSAPSRKRYEDGGYMEHGGDVDKGGMIYALREYVSSGEIANKTDVLNYDDIAKIRRIAIQYYMDNGDVPYSFGELNRIMAYANDKFKSGYMAKGGMTDHNLMVGDTIKQSFGNILVVENDGKTYLVNINTGQRWTDSEWWSLSKGEITKYTKMAKGGEIKYSTYENKSMEYIEGEIAHTERSARQFQQMGDYESMEDRKEHVRKLREIYNRKRAESKMAQGGEVFYKESHKMGH